MIFLIGEELYETLLTVYDIKFYTKLYSLYFPVLWQKWLEIFWVSRSVKEGSHQVSLRYMYWKFSLLMHLMDFYLILLDLCLYTLYKCSDLLWCKGGDWKETTKLVNMPFSLPNIWMNTLCTPLYPMYTLCTYACINCRHSSNTF